MDRQQQRLYGPADSRPPVRAAVRPGALLGGPAACRAQGGRCPVDGVRRRAQGHHRRAGAADGAGHGCRPSGRTHPDGRSPARAAAPAGRGGEHQQVCLGDQRDGPWRRLVRPHRPSREPHRDGDRRRPGPQHGGCRGDGRAAQRGTCLRDRGTRPRRCAPPGQPAPDRPGHRPVRHMLLCLARPGHRPGPDRHCRAPTASAAHCRRPHATRPRLLRRAAAPRTPAWPASRSRPPPVRQWRGRRADPVSPVPPSVGVGGGGRVVPRAGGVCRRATRSRWGLPHASGPGGCPRGTVPCRPRR